MRLRRKHEFQVLFMKTVGIIAEYNPFHNGHRFHIEETRRRTGADYVIAVISGDFVQRGAPALLSKYDRARMALLYGADLVFALPATSALSSAEGFAAGGVSLLSGLGVVDVLSFGCESAASDPEQFQKVAAILTDEPGDFQTKLSQCLKKGMSFPKARELAVVEYLRSHAPTGHLTQTGPGSDIRFRTDLSSGNDVRSANAAAQHGSHIQDEKCETAVRRLLSEPNNILALEYAKAVRKCGASMDLCMIRREGSPYHGTELSDSFSSAAAIRSHLLSHTDVIPFGFYSSDAENRLSVYTDPDPVQAEFSPADTAVSACSELRRSVPPTVLQMLQHAVENHQFLSENDFSALLHYALTTNRDHLDTFGSGSPDLAHRAANLLEGFESWTQFADLLKSRNQTRTAISRYLTHILLQIRREDFELAATYARAPYARLLGFRTSAAPLLKSIRNHADIPVLTQLAPDAASLDEDRKHLLDLDIRSAEICKHILYTKSGCRLKSEYRQSTICLP
ncbi:MAG: nucleotidyltransferase family protein [Clostridiales bacterium]|nr:nucleotidyltransferase family protein [Clostridiales bacterium]